MAEPGAIIEIRGLSKRFGGAVALQGVDLTVSSGECVALVGPNGAGKTTLLKIVAGLILPDRGAARVQGRAGLLVADERSFYPRLTGESNLLFFGALEGLSRAETRARLADDALALELPPLDRPFQEYSTGAKQRLALARCLLTRPQVLLLDEPTRSLDPRAAERLRRLLRALAVAGRAIVFSTHQAGDTDALADRVVRLEAGKVVA